MSWLSSAVRFAFSGIVAQAARAASSSNPAQAAAGNAALAAVSPGSPAGDAIKAVALSTVAAAASDVAAGIQAHNSPTGIMNTVVGDLETGLKGLVDGYVTTAAIGVPLVGGLIAPEAVKLVNLALDFGEQHALTYVSALFSHHRAAAAASVAPPTPAPLSDVRAAT